MKLTDEQLEFIGKHNGQTVVAHGYDVRDLLDTIDDLKVQLATVHEKHAKSSEQAYEAAQRLVAEARLDAAKIALATVVASGAVRRSQTLTVLRSWIGELEAAVERLRKPDQAPEEKS